MMGKIAGPLAPIKTVEPNSPSNHCILHYAVMLFFKKKKKSQVSLKDVFAEVVKIINFIKSTLEYVSL